MRNCGEIISSSCLIDGRREGFLHLLLDILDGVRCVGAEICQQSKTQVLNIVKCFFLRRQRWVKLLEDLQTTKQIALVTSVLCTVNFHSR